MATTAVAARVAGDARVRCGACGDRVEPVKPSALWWLVVVATWVFLFAVGPFLMIFPLSLVGIPFFLSIALPLVGYTSNKVHAPATCPSCARYVE